MNYLDYKKHGFIGILPNKKRYGTEKDKRILKEAILKNKDFCQKAMKENEVNYLNDILGSLIEFGIRCNEAYWKYEVKKEAITEAQKEIFQE